jgi:hypothetical protein
VAAIQAVAHEQPVLYQQQRVPAPQFGASRQKGAGDAKRSAPGFGQGREIRFRASPLIAERVGNPILQRAARDNATQIDAKLHQRLGLHPGRRQRLQGITQPRHTKAHKDRE